VEVIFLPDKKKSKLPFPYTKLHQPHIAAVSVTEIELLSMPMQPANDEESQGVSAFFSIRVAELATARRTANSRKGNAIN
jgi:hypothetical protein